MKRRSRREGARRRPGRKTKRPKIRPHMFLGRPLLAALGERRDTLTVSCSPGPSASVEVVIYSRGAAIFIFEHDGKF